MSQLIAIQPHTLKLHPDDLVRGAASSLANAGCPTIVYADRVEIEIVPRGSWATWEAIRKHLCAIAQFTTRDLYIVFHTTNSTSGSMATIPITLPRRGSPVETRTGKAA